MVSTYLHFSHIYYQFIINLYSNEIGGPKTREFFCRLSVKCIIIKLDIALNEKHDPQKAQVQRSLERQRRSITTCAPQDLAKAGLHAPPTGSASVSKCSQFRIPRVFDHNLALIKISRWYLKRFKNYRVDKQTHTQTHPQTRSHFTVWISLSLRPKTETKLLSFSLSPEFELTNHARRTSLLTPIFY